MSKKIVATNDFKKIINNYSTTEQVIGTWIDGKPLYRKVVQYSNTSTIGATGTITNISVAHNISNLKQCTSCKAFCAKYTLPVMAGNTVDKATLVTAVTTNINLRIINDTWSASNWIFILEYTKTTD